MKPAYLHDEITTARQVEQILQSKAVEDQHFEWKGDWWEGSGDETAAEEAAKDVSSMLNGDGGTILVGIDQDQQSRASQPFFRAGSEGQPDRVFKLGKRPKQLEDWLHSRLEPSEARTFVDIRPIKLERDGKKWDVLAVNVAPYPHGAVAAVYRQSKDLYRFVVREGEHAREMAWEEVVRRNEAGNRAMYLRLRRHIGSHRRKVAVRSATQIRAAGHVIEFFVEGESHGGVGPSDLHDEHVVLQLTCHRQAAEACAAVLRDALPDEQRQELERIRSDLAPIAFIANLMGISMSGGQPSELPVTVPLSFVREVWSEGDVLNFALTPKLRWENSSRLWILAAT